MHEFWKAYEPSEQSEYCISIKKNISALQNTKCLAKTV